MILMSVAAIIGCRLSVVTIHVSVSTSSAITSYQPAMMIYNIQMDDRAGRGGTNKRDIAPDAPILYSILCQGHGPPIGHRRWNIISPSLGKFNNICDKTKKNCRFYYLLQIFTDACLFENKNVKKLFRCNVFTT